MQSRLAASSTVIRSTARAIFFSHHPQIQASSPLRTLSTAPTTTPQTDDPAAIHSTEPEDLDGAEASNPEILGLETEHGPSKKEEDGGRGPIVPPTTPYASSPKLESTPVNKPTDPTAQQRRRHSTDPSALEEVSCVGFDGSLPDEKEERRRLRKEQEEDDKEYFKHHKASPLSEIEIADTRKPMSRATDGTADSEDFAWEEGGRVWRPEQLDTAEDSLRRAAEMWRESAIRGDPESPHGRVLRALRHEDW